MADTEYWIATTGDNGDDGSESTPWLTFAYALSQMAAGDILNVKDGTYQLGTSALDNLKNGSDSSHYTRILAVNDLSITFTAPVGQIIINLPDAAQYIYIRGFVADGQTTSSYGFASGIRNGSPTLSTRAQDIHLSHFKIYRCGREEGGGPAASGMKPQVRRGWYHDFEIDTVGSSSRKHSHGIYHGEFDRDSIIEDFNIHDVSNIGIQNSSAAASPENFDNTFRRGTVTGCGGQGLYFWNVSTGCVIGHVISHGNGSTGLQIAGSAGPNAIYNCLAYNNGLTGSAPGILISAANQTVKNCMSLNNQNGNTSFHASTILSNNIFTGDATSYFTDPANADFTLKNTAGTPATAVTDDIIDQGASVGQSSDIFGTAVPQGAAADVGPVEWGSAPPDAPAIEHNSPYVAEAGSYVGTLMTLADGDSNTLTVSMVGENMRVRTTPTANVSVTSP